MIIDTHVHIGRVEHLEEDFLDFFTSRNFSKDDLAQKLKTETVLKEMEANSIDKAVVFPLKLTSSGSASISELNNYIANETKKADDKLVGFFTVNPANPEQAVAEAKRAIHDLNLKGLKLHPTIQQFDPIDTSLYPLYETLMANDLPILFHTGASIPTRSDKFSDPIKFDSLAADFASLKIILAHAGRPDFLSASKLLRKHGNVFVDIAALKDKTGGSVFLEVTLAFIKFYANALDRVFWGSDYPVYSLRESLEVVEMSMPNRILDFFDLCISDEAYQGLLGNNAKRVILQE